MNGKNHNQYGTLGSSKADGSDLDRSIVINHEQDNENLNLIKKSLSIDPEGTVNEERFVYFVTYISAFSNTILAVFKIYVAVSVKSMAIIASLIDTILDLLSQLIIACVLHSNNNVDETEWPVGRTRLEPVGIIACASLMALAAIQVLYISSRQLVEGFESKEERATFLELDDASIEIMIVTILLKVALFLVCSLPIGKSNHSVTAIAEDHRNDILSNGIAMVTAYIASRYAEYWWCDPLGGILISLYIAYSWYHIAMEQIDYLVGRKGDERFTELISLIAKNHHEVLELDLVRVYHFGRRYIVEIEAVLPEDMSVRESHDIALSLQKEIETLGSVERAFVHIDYEKRMENEHKSTRLFGNVSPEEEINSYQVKKSLSMNSEKTKE